ncbi:MAG TPA: metallopeptidase TldD-related protein [Methylomirabilota bacterium]|nr:metallopeptidase TldD-related protein [Methylomirabilota bacterium]
MRALDDLRRAAQRAFDLARGQRDVREAEIFVAANAVLLARLNYTSHIPCNGVEEPKSVESDGIGVQLVLDDGGGGTRVGFGSEPSDLSPAGAARAIDKARRAAVVDPDFASLPRASALARTLRDYHDPALMDLADERLVEAGWTIVNGALRTFLASSRLAELARDDAALRRLGLIVGGDVTVLAERIAVVSTAMPDVQTDESTVISTFVTAMVEARGAKGSGWSTGTRLEHLTDEAGCEAASAAVAAIGGARVESGRYTVVFGRQPVTDLLNNIVVPACCAETFYASASPFLGRLGQRVAARELTLYDDGATPGLMGSKGITCEGLPTGRTPLIERGVLVGCLSSWYETERLLRDPRRAEKLGGGDDATRMAGLVPRNGFRFGSGGGRQFDQRPSISATNVVLEGTEPVTRDELLRRVGDGLYIGRIWYTYPINGLRAGDFTCTVVADSYIIRGGRLAEPLKPNTIRINDNIATVLNNVVGVTKDVKGTIVWATDQATYAPEIAVADVHIDAIAAFMEDLDV